MFLTNLDEHKLEAVENQEWEFLMKNTAINNCLYQFAKVSTSQQKSFHFPRMQLSIVMFVFWILLKEPRRRYHIYSCYETTLLATTTIKEDVELALLVFKIRKGEFPWCHVRHWKNRFSLVIEKRNSLFKFSAKRINITKLSILHSLLWFQESDSWTLSHESTDSTEELCKHAEINEIVWGFNGAFKLKTWKVLQDSFN